MHDWVFRHLEQLRPIYDLDSAAESASRALPDVRPAPGTARRLAADRDVAVAPMRRRPRGPGSTRDTGPSEGADRQADC